MEQISWNDAQKFILKLNLKEGTEKSRLPTEVEWEDARRAINTSAFLKGIINEIQCYRAPNLDAIGWFGVYPFGEVTNQKGPTSGSYRVKRGGVW